MSPEEFTEVYLAYREKVYYRCLGILRSHELAEEATQDAFLSLWKNNHTRNGTAQMSTWLYVVATNAALMLLRHHKKVSNSAPEVLHDFDPFSSLEARDIVNRLDVPEEFQLYAEGFSARVIARGKKQHLNKVKTFIWRSKQRLQHCVLSLLREHPTPPPGPQKCVSLSLTEQSLPERPVRLRTGSTPRTIRTRRYRG